MQINNQYLKQNKLIIKNNENHKSNICEKSKNSQKKIKSFETNKTK